MTTPNLYRDIPAQLPQELTEQLASSAHLRIERIISKGHRSPDGFWYDQGEHEWVVLLKGEALLRFEGSTEPMRLMPGDYVHIAPHVKHRVEWTKENEETVWLAVFYD
jgi:cupin 2 domain-containing protein